MTSKQIWAKIDDYKKRRRLGSDPANFDLNKEIAEYHGFQNVRWEGGHSDNLTILADFKMPDGVLDKGRVLHDYFFNGTMVQYVEERIIEDKLCQDYINYLKDILETNDLVELVTAPVAARAFALYLTIYGTKIERGLTDEQLWNNASADEGMFGEEVFCEIEELKRRGFTEELKKRGFKL